MQPNTDKSRHDADGNTGHRQSGQLQQKPVSASAGQTPRNWVDGSFGLQKLTLVKGLITATVVWAVSGPSGYIARINDRPLKRRFEHIAEAKAAVELLLDKVAAELQYELGMLRMQNGTNHEDKTDT